MNLSYRGIAYQPASPAVHMTSAEHTGIFLGNRFTLQTSTATRHSMTTTLKYRGAHYTA